MGTRLELQDTLEHVFVDVGKWLWGPPEPNQDDILQAIEENARDHVYFQPPSTIRMKYPCIVYNLERMDINYADNLPYKNKKRYSVTVIDKNPDSEIPEVVAKLPLVSSNRVFTNDNLYHYVFQLYF